MALLLFGLILLGWFSFRRLMVRSTVGRWLLSLETFVLFFFPTVTISLFVLLFAAP